MERKERTLVLIKPDAIQRSLIAEILGRLERVGLKLAGIKMIIPTAEHARNHYLLDPDWLKKVGSKSIKAYKEKGLTPPEEDPIKSGERVLKILIKYISSGPVIAMVWQGAHAVEIVRKLVGGTEPLTSDVGTIRGDFVLDSYKVADVKERAVRNLVHASGSTEEADKEIGHWYDEDDINNYRLVQEQILYDVNLDGILE